jgi:hypothetical protein
MERQKAAPRDAYDTIRALWSRVPHGAKVPLLYELITSLPPDRLEELREVCEDEVVGWGSPWE